MGVPSASPAPLPLFFALRAWGIDLSSCIPQMVKAALKGKVLLTSAEYVLGFGLCWP